MQREQPPGCAGRGCAAEAAAVSTGARMGGGSGAVFEAPAVVPGLDDLAMMSEAIEQSAGHFRITEDARPFAEGQVGGDDD